MCIRGRGKQRRKLADAFADYVFCVITLVIRGTKGEVCKEVELSAGVYPFGSSLVIRLHVSPRVHKYTVDFPYPFLLF